MRPRPFLEPEPGPSHPARRPARLSFPGAPFAGRESRAPSKLWVSGRGALQGVTVVGAPRQAHRELPPPANVQHPQHGAGRGAPRSSGRDSQFPHHVVLAPHPASCADAPEPSVGLLGSEAGPAPPPPPSGHSGPCSPSKGSFLSHFPGLEGQSDSSPAPHGAAFRLTPRDLPHPPSPPPCPRPPIALDLLLLSHPHPHPRFQT